MLTVILVSGCQRMHSQAREFNGRWNIKAEDNARVKIEDENYFLGADGKLMPTRKDQPPPDLKYFVRKQR